MNKRGVFGALALVLALVGGVLLFLYVSGADDRAMATLEPVPVLVVSNEIPAGLGTAEMAQYVEVREIPTDAVVPGALTKASELPPGQVAVTALQPGEQVLAARFVSADDNQVAASVPIPEGLQLVSIQLSPERVAGAQLNAGDKVGVFASMEVEVETVGIAPAASPSPAPAPTAGEEEEDTRFLTKLIANDVLVARVQGAQSTQPTDDETAGTQTLPGSEVIVTLAVDAPLAGKIVFTKEYGSIWLSRQTPATEMTESRIVEAWTVFE
ncbi:Flp pilus assembly protein CpaB [Tessaracoccus sp. MC1756]|uniref:Flp pilus assembly protein CpaB n=1 Tax=Tessaracoccus sp. MC1756 TaxID=2760311 RepID=UPI001602F8FC|nr:RcpC/CpaB family pilus assembly protein [Tessaracoccus sp. MC1756]MBB1509470.1 hypothetical protein [Tessaracoccus sp. MC1756]